MGAKKGWINRITNTIVASIHIEQFFHGLKTKKIKATHMDNHKECINCWNN